MSVRAFKPTAAAGHKIAAVAISHHRLPLVPPFNAAERPYTMPL